MIILMYNYISIYIVNYVISFPTALHVHVEPKEEILGPAKTDAKVPSSQAASSKAHTAQGQRHKSD